MEARKTPMVLMADDDEDDCVIAKDAFKESGAHGVLHCVENGMELMNYLSGCPPLPALILLDLNMPQKDGRQALREIKSVPELRKIPVVVLSTSREEKDIAFSRRMGADSFITKPTAFAGWVKMMKSFDKNWLFDQ